jgi:hypothetical protein
MGKISLLLGISVGISLLSGLPAQSVEVSTAPFWQIKTIAASSKSALPKPKISRGFKSNTLTSSIGKIKKSAEVSYQWTRNGSPIQGEVSKTYQWKIADCRQDIQVIVTVKERGKKRVSKVSTPYNPETCTYTSGDIPAWSILYDCGIKTTSTLARCTETFFNGTSSFNGFVYRSEKAQTWFRIPFPEVDPGRVISWTAQAKGLGSRWALSLVMITKNQPSWACCDWVGTKFPPKGFLESQTSDEVLGLSSDGSAYVGFDYYDKFGVYESLTVGTIEVSIKFK